MRLLEKLTDLENRAAAMLRKRGHIVRLDDRRLEIFKKSVAAVGVPSAVLFPLGTVGLSAEGITTGLIALGGASSNFLLGAAWGTCLDIGGRRSGAVSAAMNTSGQVGAILSPILVAAVVRRFSNWSAPLYLAGVLFMLGAVCWLWIDPTEAVAE